MWFKNLTLFECTEKFKCSEEELSGFLKDQAFIPCTSIDPVSISSTLLFFNPISIPYFILAMVFFKFDILKPSMLK